MVEIGYGNTILIVDDEKDIVNFLKNSLIFEGYDVLVSLNGTDALKQLKKEIDLIILDVMLPDINGFDLCLQIREYFDCPIIFISADNREKSKIEGLMIGGDDYINKPFSIKELKARVVANLRRRNENIKKESTLSFGDLKIDLQKYEVSIKNQHIAFTKTEFQLLKTLALHPQQVLTKEQLFNHVWGYTNESDLTTVVEHIKKIRFKLASLDSDYKYIETSWGIGYKWVCTNAEK